MKVFLTPKPPATANGRTELPPSPDSPWDDVLDSCPQSSQTKKIIKDLEKAIETDEWKAVALKKHLNLFGGPGLLKPANLGGASVSNTKESSTLPAVQHAATNAAPGKRQRLK